MSELQFLQDLSERELRELVILPLVEAMGYRDIRYTHGTMERGKDIVCSRSDPIDGREYIGFTIKAYPLDGSVSSSRSIREVHYQIKQSLAQPFLNPFNGDRVALQKVYVLTPHTISQQAIASLSGEIEGDSRILGFIDGPKLLDLLNLYAPDLLSSLPDPRKRYLHDLLRRLLQARNLSSFGTLREVSLAEIYTGGYLSPTTPDEAKYMSFAREENSGIGEDFNIVLSRHPFSVLLADVGAGKTTLLQKRALDTISFPDYSAPNPESSAIPILLELSRMSRKDASDLDSFREWLRKSIASTLRNDNFDLNEVSEPYMLLLDGFDEVQGDHNSLAEHIKTLPDIFKSGVVLTSRPTRIPMLGPKFSYFRVDPFRSEEIKLFLGKWFHHDADKREQLFLHIVNDPDLFQFCKTPLLLTLYSALASATEVESLPTRRTDIYEAITSMLVGKWDLMRKVKNYFSPGAKIYCLESLAFALHARRRKSFSRQELRDACRRVVRSGNSSPDDLADELVFRSSLVRSNDSGLYEFAHLSFQEYFAAKQFVRLANQKKVQNVLFIDWYKNVLGFYFGLTRTMDEIRISEKVAAGNGHILLEFLVEADYTGNETRDLILSIMAKQVLSYSSLPASVLGACRKLEDSLVAALVLSVRKNGSPEQIFNFFNFLIALGASTGKRAKTQTQLLSSLRPDSASLLLLSLLDRLDDPDWRSVWEDALRVMHDLIRDLSKMSHAKKEETSANILLALGEVERRLTRTSNISHQYRVQSVRRVEYIRQALVRIANLP